MEPEEEQWAEEFHAQAQEEEIGRLRERDEQLKEEIDLLRANGEDERQIYVEEIKRLKSRLADSNRPRTEPPPELGGETVSFAGRSPQRGMEVSKSEMHTAAQESEEVDNREYAGQPTPEEEPSQRQFDEMRLILLNNKPEKRAQEGMSKSKQRKTNKDFVCGPMEDWSVPRESRDKQRLDTPLGYQRASISDPDVFVRKPASQQTERSHHGGYSSNVRGKEGGNLEPRKIERARRSARQITEELPDTDSVDSGEEEEEPHHSKGPWGLKREDCIRGVDSFESPFQKPRQKQITPEPLTGDVPLQEYLGQFESIATWNGWTESQKAQQLFMSLRGRARGVIRDQNEWRTITYQELVERLRSTFSGQAELYLAQLRGRQQKQQDSLQDFAQSIRKLTDNAYVGMEEPARDRIARDHFMSNLRDREIRAAVHLSRPTSMEAALQTALETEAFLVAEGQRQPTKFTRSVEPGDQGMQDQLREVIGLLRTVAEEISKPELRKLSEPTGRGQTTTDTRAPNNVGERERRRDNGRQGRERRKGCYRCGALDHYIANCPQTLGNPKGEWSQSGNDVRPNLGAQGGSQVRERAPEKH
jgi:hypothetical protein